MVSLRCNTAKPWQRPLDCNHRFVVAGPFIGSLLLLLLLPTLQVVSFSFPTCALPGMPGVFTWIPHYR